MVKVFSKTKLLPFALGLVVMVAFVVVSLRTFGGQGKPLEYESAPQEVKEIIDRNHGKVIPVDQMRQITIATNKQRQPGFGELVEPLQKGWLFLLLFSALALAGIYMFERKIDVMDMIGATLPGVALWIYVISL
jgi:hypothetical protein